MVVPIYKESSWSLSFPFFRFHTVTMRIVHISKANSYSHFSNVKLKSTNINLISSKQLVNVPALYF